MNKKIKFVLIIFIIIVVMLLGIIFFRYNILKDILTRYNKSISDINYYYSYENEEGKNQYEANSVNDIDVQKPDISEYTKQ